MSKKYTVDDIVKMEELEHIRKNQGMYVGDSEDSTRLLEEVLDNALDEVQAGFATIIGVYIDTKKKRFKVLDNGRGIPFDEKKPVENDPPVMICNSLFTSGKFDKTKDDSVYKVAVGLHGVGMTCVRALSDEMNIEVHREGKHATYTFKHNGSIHRDIEDHSGKVPFSTKVEVKPSKKYFDSTNIDLTRIEERLKIATANFPKLKVVYIINNKNHLIDSTEDKLIEESIGGDIDTWITLKTKKKIEVCKIKFQWAQKGAMKAYTTVNLCKVKEGAHVNKFSNMIKGIFETYKSKYSYSFEPNDCLVGLRLYINLNIVEVSFSEQVKDRLGNRSNLDVMDGIEKEIIKYFEKNEEHLTALLSQFQEYRETLKQKKLKDHNTSGKRGFSKLTKLRDCTKEGGELIIGEGDSAIGGLIKARNKKDKEKYAILPLKGVVPNVLNRKDFYENKELKDIIIACGCGILNNCDVSKLRYRKIILAADADPAGQWITVLLIALFAYTMRPVIERGRLYVCQTPLYGVRRKGNFVPLWDKEDVEKAKNKNESVTRFKGLGEFNPADLKVFTMTESTRKLIQVKWSEKHHEKLFELMSSSSEKRKLALGTWSLEE